jgi:hypothetical protein
MAGIASGTQNLDSHPSPWLGLEEFSVPKRKLGKAKSHTSRPHQMDTHIPVPTHILNVLESCQLRAMLT